MAQLKDTTITGGLAVSGTTNLTGDTQANSNVTLYAPSGDSPAIIFQRGTSGDTLNDYKIYDSGGFIKVKQQGNSGTSGFTQVAELTNAGKLTVSTPPATDTTPGTTAWISPTDSAIKIATDATIASGDKIVIRDASNSNIARSSSITFGSSTTTYLRNDGTWGTPSGGGSSGIVVHVRSELQSGELVYTTTADWDDTYDALLNGSNVIMQIDTLDMQQTSIVGGSDYYVYTYSSTNIVFQNHTADLALSGTADAKETFTWSKTSPTVMTRSKLINVPVGAVEISVSDRDSYIPSSKAVKTYVDNTLATSGNVFWCTHGSTTDTEIQNALNANKLPVVVYNGNLYVYYWTTSGYRYFMSFVNNTHSRIMMTQSSSYWGTPTNLLMEQTSNKVTAIDSTAADNKYPSALAVKTYVDNTLATSGNVFWCTYGTTTASEVQTAIDSGKYPVVKGSSYTLPFITDDGTYYRFCGVNKNTMRAFYLKKDNNVWSDGFWQNAVITTQIKTSISSSSTDTDIPSAKCVYDALSTVPPSYVFDATISSTTVTLSDSKTIGDLVTVWNNGANEVYIKVSNSKYRISNVALISTGYYYLYTDGIINAMSPNYRSVSYLYVNMSASESSNTLLYSSLPLDVSAVVFSATLSGTTVTLSSSKTLNDIYSAYSLSGTKQVYITVDNNRFAVTRCIKNSSTITLDTAPVHVYTGSHTIRAVYASALAETSTTLTHYSKTL